MFLCPSFSTTYSPFYSYSSPPTFHPTRPSTPIIPPHTLPPTKPSTPILPPPTFHPNHPSTAILPLLLSILLTLLLLFSPLLVFLSVHQIPLQRIGTEQEIFLPVIASFKPCNSKWITLAGGKWKIQECCKFNPFFF